MRRRSSRRDRRRLGSLLGCAIALLGRASHAAPSQVVPLAPLVPLVPLAPLAPPLSRVVDPSQVIDRVVVRFDAAETGGAAQPLFIFERELAFEARIEALADTEHPDRTAPYLDRHVRAALERHIAEELLAHLTVEPALSASDLAFRTTEARGVVEHRAGGRAAFEAAAAAEGLGALELEQVIVREARASLYIDRMIAPMLEPSEAELRELSRSANPFRGRPFDEIAPLLRRWYVSERLDAALQAFFQNVRGRVHIVYLGKG